MNNNSQNFIKAYKCEECGRIASDFELIFSRQKWYECKNHGIICREHVDSEDSFLFENFDTCLICKQRVYVVYGKFNHEVYVDVKNEIKQYAKIVQHQTEIVEAVQERILTDKILAFYDKLKKIRMIKFSNILNSFFQIKDFDYAKFISELKNNSENQSLISEYETYVGRISSNYISEKWFVDYVSKFSCSEILLNVPVQCKNEFNWNLLLQLIASSFSSSYILENRDNNLISCVITVKTDVLTVTKSIEELSFSQIEKLYNIYIIENMQRQVCYEYSKSIHDDFEYEAIEIERTTKLKIWNEFKELVVK